MFGICIWYAQKDVNALTMRTNVTKRRGNKDETWLLTRRINLKEGSVFPLQEISLPYSDSQIDNPKACINVIYICQLLGYVKYFVTRVFGIIKVFEICFIVSLFCHFHISFSSLKDWKMHLKFLCTKILRTLLNFHYKNC